MLLLLAFSLLAGPGDVDRLRKNGGEVVAALVDRCDRWPESHVRNYGLKEWALPAEGSGWSHAYVCPEHGMRLQQKAGKNLCPVDGKDYHGWPVDYVVYMMRNGDNAHAARDLGLAWRLTGKTEYLEKARRIFNAYSEIYPTLPIHDNNNKRDAKSGARVMSQTLSESGWLMPLAFGYDLVREDLTGEERARFETNVLRNAAAVIRRYQAGKSNWQSWHNAALLAVGLLVKDEELVKLALDGPGGFKFQMRESITADGPWFEGAWGYHFFSLEPLLLTREMAVRAGIALPEATAIKKMLDAPLRCVFPDGTLPAFNDSGRVDLSKHARHYDIGYRVFRDSSYLAMLKQGDKDLESVLWGSEKVPSGQGAALGSELLPNAGVATLRAAGSDFTVAVKFGPHGGGHGHFDKLSLVSYANGTPQGVDPGTQAYAAKTHGTWDKMTVAHNTVTVDEKTQSAASGKVLEWRVTPEATVLRVETAEAYEGVTLRRTLVQTAAYLLDIFDVKSSDGKPHQFDWAYHNAGKVSTPLAMTPYTALPAANGYEHLTSTLGAATGEAWTAAFNGLELRMLGAPGTTVVTGQGLGPDLRAPVPFVMARRSGTGAHFVALHVPVKGAAKALEFREVGDGVYQVGGDLVELKAAGTEVRRR